MIRARAQLLIMIDYAVPARFGVFLLDSRWNMTPRRVCGVRATSGGHALPRHEHQTVSRALHEVCSVFRIGLSLGVSGQNEIDFKENMSMWLKIYIGFFLVWWTHTRLKRETLTPLQISWDEMKLDFYKSTLWEIFTVTTSPGPPHSRDFPVVMHWHILIWTEQYW